MENPITPNPTLEPVQPEEQAPSKSNNSLVVILSILLLIAVIIAGLFYFQIQKLSKELSKYQAQASPTPTATANPTADWKIYTDTKYNYEFKYPSDYSVKSENKKTTVRSTPTECRTDVAGSMKQEIGYDTEITIIYYTGESYKDIWEKAFDFEFDPSNPNLSSDGTKTISGKTAYYFFQGAEMTYGRTAYLVELTPISALEINLYVPVLLFNCERPLDQFKGQQIADQILSTFQFLGNEKPAGNGTDCQYKGKTYKDGEAIPSGDKCNSCSCDNGQVACTAMACE